MPTFAPFLGTVIGVIIYQLMVGFHMEGEVRDRKTREEEENLGLTNIPADANSKHTKQIL